MRSGRRIMSLAVLLPLFAGCGSEGPPRPIEDTAEVAYVDGDAEFPKLRFGDGQISLNDRCMVRQAKLNDRLSPIYVNGKPVGFC